MTFEELIEVLDNLAESERKTTTAFALSQAAAYLVRQQIVINELHGEIARLQQLAKYD